MGRKALPHDALILYESSVVHEWLASARNLTEGGVGVNHYRGLEPLFRPGGYRVAIRCRHCRHPIEASRAERKHLADYFVRTLAVRLHQAVKPAKV